MNSDPASTALATKVQEPGLSISLRAVPSTITVSGGREIPFTKARLSMRNNGQSALVGLVPHATLDQAGGLVQDVTAALSPDKDIASISPGQMLEWEIYELLATAHPGVASKVHLFGFKAVLNWWFDLAAWAEFHTADSAAQRSTPVYRWKLRWSPATTALEAIYLSIEAVTD